MRLRRCRVPAQRSGIGWQCAGQQAQQRRLAALAATHEAQAGADVQAQAVEQARAVRPVP